MKRIISIFVFVACVMLSQAATITQSQAMERAQQFFAKDAPMRVGSITRPTTAQVQLAHTAVSKVGTVDFYVFNHASDAGYVIVSADDQLVPVLGYADSGSFNEQDIPDGLRYWLDEYQRQIEYLKSHPDESRAAQAVAKEVKPLLTCNWNQSAPYNNNCPTYTKNGSTYRTVTGCVATATAQIMYYHKWPLQGTGSHSYTSDTQGYNLSANFANSHYDWANMVDNYGSSNTSVQNAAVAKLMSDVGISVDMDYGESSGAHSPDVAVALPTYFGYDKSIQIHIRNAYGVAAWEKLIRDELDVARPVYYSGQAAGGGHAFVCDGYDTQGYFHFNWGWGGQSNGYFILSMLNPREQGIGSFEGGYNSSQTIITRIMPDEGGTPSTNAGTVGTVAMSTSASSVALGSSASFTVNQISMSGIKDWNESLYWFFAVTEPTIDATTYIDYSYVVDATTISVGNSYSVRDSKFTPSTSLAEGKYYIRYAFQKDGRILGFFTGSTPSDYIIEMEVKDGRAYFNRHVEPSSIVASDFVTSGNPVYKGNAFNVKFKVTNNGSNDYYDKIYIALMKGDNISQEGDPISLGIAANSSVNLSFDITPNVSVGDYRLTIRNANKEAIGSIPITVAEAGTSAPVLVEFTPAAAEMPANDVRATAKITNTSGVFSGPIKMYVMYRGDNGLYISKTISSDIITLKSGETATINFKGEFAGSVGSTYYLGLQDPTTTNAQLWASYYEFKVCDYDPYAPAVAVGDVNGDGDIDIADVNSIVSIILEQKQTSDFVGNADVNNDDDIDIADINAIISIILSKK